METVTAADPLHGASRPETYWSTTNAAEAMPGVQTPLGWSVWAPICEIGIRNAFAAMGALPRSAVFVPDRQEDRTYNIFYGRVALQVDFFFAMGNLLPGTDGAAVIKQWLDAVPPEWSAPSSRRRYAVIAARMPATFATVPRRTRAVRAATEAWYQPELGRIATLDLPGALAAFAAANDRLRQNLLQQAETVLCGVQPMFDQLRRLVEDRGSDTAGLFRGYGSHEETRLVADLWACSRDRLNFEEVVRAHGYHGPNAGELASVTWREDPTALKTMVDRYRAQPDSADPVAAESRNERERQELEKALLADLPRAQRAKARAILHLAHRYVPLRGIGKVAFLQALDVSRCAARRCGQHLADAGVLANRDDVFFLTADELAGGMPTDARAVVASRRQTWQEYQELNLPSTWKGEPTAFPVQDGADAGPERTGITGTGCSPGVVEGTIRVVTNPTDAEIEEGDVLVVHTTDPSWASIMFLCSALVVDIGGLMSHAAVVARELGIPCVMGTGNGTKVLHSGERCRVDGTTGTVELLAVPVAPGLERVES
jgi:pyruvate,water dikinase